MKKGKLSAKTKKLIIKIVAAVLVVSIGTAAALIVKDRKTDYSNEQKLSVAMNTIVTQKIYADVPGVHLEPVKAIIDSLDGYLSCKDEDSVLSRLNREGALNDVLIGEALRTCLEVSEKSGGAFDVTMGKLSDAWGIGTENARVLSDEEVQTLLSQCGYEKITLDGNKITLSDGVSIDLGAVGKGIACDYIMAYLKSKDDIKGAVVSVGGSILTYGQHNKAGDKWNVGIRHPRKENEYLGIIHMTEGFVSTSGDYERYFEQDGVRYHHILDGNTGYPSDSGLISVTVVAESGILSDALSTACLVLGEEKAEELLRQYGASGVLVDENMNITVVGDIDFEY